MKRIAAPMVGGMVTAPLLSMLVLPAAYFLLQRGRLRRAANLSSTLEGGSHEAIEAQVR
jgi:Cu(I)/Ag(I) efflux system membrane protein CusA/SilA